MNAVQVSPRTSAELAKVAAEFAELLASGQYAAIAEITQGRRLTAGQLRQAVQDYGRTIIPLPAAGLEALPENTYPFADDPDSCTADVDLWTAEEGRSYLTLELQLRAVGEVYEISVRNLHIM